MQGFRDLGEERGLPPIVPISTVCASSMNMVPSSCARLCAHHLRQLKRPTFLREYEKLAAEAAREGLGHVRFLLRFAELELIDRERRMVERRIRAARFPVVKSFDTFDFAAIPSLNKPLVLELARCA
jgi:DNA replication protein DnaC